MAAKAFGARRTFFATNGTSTANKVIFQTLLAPGEKLLLDRNCHKSVHHGVVLSGAHPIYLDSALNRKYGLYGPVPKKTLLKEIRKHPDAQALILTSCTYDGLRYDLEPIVARGAREGHQGDRRRGLVRLRALPPGVPPDRAGGGRRLRDAVHAQGALGVLAGLDDPRQRPGLPRAPVPRELQHAHLHQPAVRR